MVGQRSLRLSVKTIEFYKTKIYHRATLPPGGFLTHFAFCMCRFEIGLAGANQVFTGFTYSVSKSENVVGRCSSESEDAPGADVKLGTLGTPARNEVPTILRSAPDRVKENESIFVEKSSR